MRGLAWTATGLGIAQPLVPTDYSLFPNPSFIPAPPARATIAASPFRGNTGRDGDCVGRDRRLRRSG